MRLIVKLTKAEVDQIVKKVVEEKYKKPAVNTNALFHQKSFDGYEISLKEEDSDEESEVEEREMD